MSLNPRQQEMLTMVRTQGFVAIDVLAEQFDVTPQTIRRDVNALCERGLLRRFHGGAGLPSSTENLAYQDRKILNREAKQAIAREVARHIPNHASLFINLGTTTEAVAQALSEHVGLRVITNNLNVAGPMSINPDFEVIVAGGVVRPRDQGVTGEATIDFIGQFKVDFGIIGISGIDDDGTLRDFDYREVRVAEAIIQHSRRVFLVADESKFGRNALVRLGHLRQIDALFTDKPLSDDMKAVAQDSGCAVFVAGEETMSSFMLESND